MLGHRKLEVGDYLAILKRRRTMIIVPTILLPILAIAITFYIPARYLSQTLVLVEDQKVPDTIVRPVVSEDLDSRLASMKEQILSRSHVQPIVERYNLYATEHLNMDDRIEKARAAIEIKPIHSEINRGGGLPGFFISFTASDARTAQLVCGEITSLFTNENLRSREAAAEGTTDFLRTQLAAAKRSLDDQDAKLAAFQTQNGGRLPGEEVSNVNVLTSLNTQLEAANEALQRMEQDKSYQESLLAQQVAATTPVTADGTPVAPTVGTPEQQTQLTTLQTQLADLNSHYTPDYPDVIATKRKIADLKKDMAAEGKHSSGGSVHTARNPDSVGLDQLRAQIRSSSVGIAAKQAEQANIQKQIGNYQARIASSPQVEEQYKDLTRDYETAQKFYDDLLAKMNQSKMATDLELQQQGEQFRVMDEPNLPDAPSFPNRFLFALAGLVLGLVSGLLLSAFMEYKDTALRSEQDVWAFTRLPTLAVLPFAPEIATDAHPLKFVWLRRLFGRTPKEPLADAGS